MNIFRKLMSSREQAPQTTATKIGDRAERGTYADPARGLSAGAPRGATAGDGYVASTAARGHATPPLGLTHGRNPTPAGVQQAGLAADWAALRPKYKDAADKLPRQAAALERKVQALPPAARLGYLVGLAVHAVLHDQDAEATLFLQDPLLPVLQRHVPANGAERTMMETFALQYDNAYPFTGASRRGDSGEDLYENQLSELTTSGPATLLGFLYLHEVRSAQLPAEEASDHERILASLPRYAFLQETRAFGGR